VISRVTRGGAPGEASGSLTEADLLLVDAGGRLFPAEAVASAVARSAADRWGGAWEQVSDAEYILDAASRHYPQFRSTSWTWAR
jgi:hypothetical protein